MNNPQIYNSKVGYLPRTNWEKLFKLMHTYGDDELLIHDVFENEIFDDNRSKESEKP